MTEPDVSLRRMLSWWGGICVSFSVAFQGFIRPAQDPIEGALYYSSYGMFACLIGLAAFALTRRRKTGISWAVGAAILVLLSTLR